MNSRDFNARAIARALIDSRVHWGEKRTFYRWIRNFIYFPISLLFGQDDLHKSHRLWQEWRLPFVSNENFLEGTNIPRFFFWKISPPFARFTLLFFRRNISCFCLFWLFSSLNENVCTQHTSSELPRIDCKNQCPWVRSFCVCGNIPYLRALKTIAL